MARHRNVFKIIFYQRSFLEIFQCFFLYCLSKQTTKCSDQFQYQSSLRFFVYYRIGFHKFQGISIILRIYAIVSGASLFYSFKLLWQVFRVLFDARSLFYLFKVIHQQRGFCHLCKQASGILFLRILLTILFLDLLRSIHTSETQGTGV